ncbi:YciI family protein [Variovorax sp. VNK109]|uniref:YciI family protein n=1 Tax=Variovorax sp. VNK109 TaxID=3400919 RepID=UPI003C0170C7
MKYLGLAYYIPEKFAAMSPADVQALVSQCPPLDEKMRATGKVLVSASLGESKDWMTLRPRAGKPQISDGPYIESKELVGGLFIIDAATREEALSLAAMHPAATLGEEGGWGVELIPMDFFLGNLTALSVD